MVAYIGAYLPLAGLSLLDSISLSYRCIEVFPLPLHSGFLTTLNMSEEVVLPGEDFVGRSAARGPALESVLGVTDLLMHLTSMTVEISA
jgi:hypothetical protein